MDELEDPQALKDEIKMLREKLSQQSKSCDYLAQDASWVVYINITSTAIISLPPASTPVSVTNNKINNSRFDSLQKISMSASASSGKTNSVS